MWISMELLSLQVWAKSKARQTYRTGNFVVIEVVEDFGKHFGGENSTYIYV